jgi:hydroxypyruvate reductase
MSIEQDAWTIIEESIQSVLPDTAVQRALVREDLAKNTVVVAVGKAAWRMAKTAADTLGDRMRCGIVLTKYGHTEGPIERMEILEAGHPMPDFSSVLGARKVLALVDPLTERDTVLFLVSGGGSALFELPLPGVTLEDVRDVTEALLTSGADIVEINAVRKHLSLVKGGRFAQRCAPAHVRAIVLSDVLGDALDSIASGPAHPDATTSEDAFAVLEKYNIEVNKAVRAALGVETPKRLENVRTEITGNVTQLCEAAMHTAQRLGYRPLLLTTTLDGEAREAGAMLAAIAREIRRSGMPLRPPCAVICGGETVVHVRGHGKGGRNQEVALAAARGIAGLMDVVVFSVGSDGTDGPTDAAGGLVDGALAGRCRLVGRSIDRALRDNDAYTLLKAMDGLVVTGPTGTNVNDLAVVLCG